MEKNNKSDASLVVVGSGIKFMSHLTTEAKAYIEQSDRVLYLVNDTAMKEWIQKSNVHAESLDEIYKRYSLRLDSYRAITKYILDTLYTNCHVCVVLYGHPTVFAKPGLDAVLKAREEGYDAKALPGISAEDCLFADLLINPGSGGCQSFEATDFLIRRRQADTSNHLILWQIGIIGALHYPESHNNEKGIRILVEHLSHYYDRQHVAVLYEAAQYPFFEPHIQRLTLEELVEVKVSAITTLYIPPAKTIPCDISMLEALGISISDLQQHIKN